MSTSFWCTHINPKSTKKTTLPEGCSLELTNVAIDGGKHSDFYLTVEGKRVLAAVLDSATCPAHVLSAFFDQGTNVSMSNDGDATLSICGVQTTYDDDDEDDEDYEDDEEFDEDEDDEDHDEDDDEDDDEDEEEDEDDEDEEEEEEEKPKKGGMKRPEPPKNNKKAEPKPKQAKKEDKKPEKPGAGGSSAHRCELCKRTFNTKMALDQHNAAKHGKK